jgi:pyruvate kinase
MARRRTKIVATIGPSSRDEATLRALVEAGLDVARLNFSHGSHESHAETIARIRAAASAAGRAVAVLADLPGPKVRTGRFRDGISEIKLEPGRPFELRVDGGPGDETGVPVSYGGLCDDVRVGDMVFLADGAIALRAVAKDAEAIQTEVVVGGALRERQGIAYPDGTLNIGAVTPEDFEHLAFALDRGVDLVAVSFVRAAQDLNEVRAFTREHGLEVPLIAKIERREALDAIEEIVEAADGIMVARGDLGISIPLERVPRTQKDLIRRANSACKPVITATQMLESMIDNVRPTRAEAADVANAILDGTDAVMLSAETARGAHPLEAVRTMARIAEATEADYPYRTLGNRPLEASRRSMSLAIAEAAVGCAEELNIRWIVTGSTSGNTARFIASFRPSAGIIALTPVPAVANRLAMVWGVEPVLVDAYPDFETFIPIAERHVRERGLVAEGEAIVITSGMPVGAGRTNVLKLHRVQ